MRRIHGRGGGGRTVFEGALLKLLNPVLFFLFCEEGDRRDLVLESTRLQQGKVHRVRRASSTSFQPYRNECVCCKNASGGGLLTERSVPRSVRRTSLPSSFAAAEVCFSKKTVYASLGMRLTSLSEGV